MSLERITQRTRQALNQPPSLATIFIISLLIYLGAAWLLYPVDTPWSPDEGAKLLQLKNLHLEAGHLGMEIPYTGIELDPGLEFATSENPKDLLSVSGAGLAFERLPIFPIAVWPLYLWLGAYGLYILPAAAGALCSVLALALLRPRDRRLGMWILIAFGSPIFIYSTQFWEHTLGSCAALAGAYLILQETRHSAQRTNFRASRWVLGACILGSAAYIRLETILFSTALLAACWLTRKDWRRWVVMAGLTLLLAMLPYRTIHRAFFQGEPMPANARYLNLPLAHIRTVGWRAIPDLLVGPPEEEGIDPGWLGGLWSAAAIIAVAHSFTPAPNRTTQNLERLGLFVSGVVAAYFLVNPTLYRAAHGLIFTTPWALLGFTRAADIWKTGDQRAKVIIATVYLGLLGYAIAILGVRASSPQGGLEWGARFALTFYPLLALIAAWDWRSFPKIDRIIILALITLGIGFQMRGLATIRRDRETSAALNHAIANLPEEHLLTDLWWLALNAAPIHGEKALYTVKSPQEGALWVLEAGDHGISHFALVTLDHAMPSHITSHLMSENAAVELTVLDLIQLENLLIYPLEIKSIEEP